MVADPAGHVISTIPWAAPIATIHKRQWWNVLVGNPAGYLPDDAGVERIEPELAPTDTARIRATLTLAPETFVAVMVDPAASGKRHGGPRGGIGRGGRTARAGGGAPPRGSRRGPQGRGARTPAVAAALAGALATRQARGL